MDKEYLKIALLEAKKAYKDAEIPIGCVIVKDNIILAKTHNCKEITKNCIMHAEILAISEACEKMKDWRLDGCSMYVTLEPCMMCMGAIIESRIKNVYYGTKNNNEQMYDYKKISKIINICNLNDENCSKILSDFFKNRRKK